MRHGARAVRRQRPHAAAAARLRQHLRDPRARRRRARSAGCARSTMRRGWRREWRAGFGYEFLERPDGYRRAGEDLRPDVSRAAAGHGPDAQLPGARVGPGRSDRRRRDGRADQEPRSRSSSRTTARYFPPYDAVPVARAATLLRYPQVRRALEGLAGRITAADMREMNHAADAQRENPADIARRFLDRAADSRLRDLGRPVHRSGGRHRPLERGAVPAAERGGAIVGAVDERSNRGIRIGGACAPPRTAG